MPARLRKLYNIQSITKEHDMNSILFLHGIGSSNKSNRIRWLKNNLDMRTFTPNFPQHGNNKNEFSIKQILKQIDKTISEMKSSDKKFLVARSFGGYIALLILKKYPNFFDKVCLLSPVINMQETTQILIEYKYISQDFKIGNIQLIAPTKYIRYDKEIQTINLQTPTLIIQGLQDTITKCGTLAKFLKNKQTFKLETFDTGHDYKKYKHEINQMTKEWILKTKSL